MRMEICGFYALSAIRPKPEKKPKKERASAKIGEPPRYGNTKEALTNQTLLRNANG